jgi:hypothetical protein
MIIKTIGLFFNKLGNMLFILFSCMFVFFGLRNDIIYLSEHKMLAQRDVENMLGREIYDDQKITLEQMERAVVFIEENREPDAIVRIAADNTFARPIFYLLQYKNKIPSCYIKTSSFHPSGTLDYFFIYRRSVNEEMPQEFNSLFTAKKQTRFGNFLIIDAQAKNPGGQAGEDEICYNFL